MRVTYLFLGLQFFSVLCSYISITPYLGSSTSSNSYADIYLNIDSSTFDFSGGKSISLSLSPSSTLTGSTSCSTVSGYCRIGNFLVKYSGTFVLCASDSLGEYSSSCTSSFSVTGTKAFNSITWTPPPSSPSANFYFTVTPTIKDGFDSTTSNTCTIVLTEQGGSTLYGTTTASSVNSNAFSIYLKDYGFKTIVATCTGNVGDSSLNTLSGNLAITILQNYLKFTLTSYTSSMTSQTAFSVVVGVYDNSRTTLENVNGNSYSISLVLAPSGSFDKTTSGTTTSGEITFSNLRIISAGTFNLYATCNGMLSATSSLTTVTNYVYQVSISSATITTSVNFDFTFTVTLKGEDLTYYATSTDVTISDTGSCLQGTKVSPTSASTGTVSFTLYCNTQGTFTMTASAVGYNNAAVTSTATLYINSLILKIDSLTPTPTTTLSTFTITIGVYNNEGTTKESARGSYSITLTLSGTAKFSSSAANTISGSSSSGTYSVSSERIISPGTLTITASSSTITSVQSSSLPITNYVHSVEIATDTATPTKNFVFTVTVTLKGEDSTAYTGSVTITLTDSQSYLSGTTSVTTSSGTATFNAIYLTTSGTATVITATCPASGSYIQRTATVSVTGQNLILALSGFTGPVNSLTSFTITITVKDNSGASTESLRGPYPIALTITNSGVILGTVTGSTASGTISFSSLRILSRGTYVITAASTTAGVTSISTTSFQVINYPHTVTLATSNSTPSKNFLFTITATIKGEDNAAYTGSCTLTLTGTSLAGTLSDVTSTGTLVLSNVYVTATGQVTITGTCPLVDSNPAKSGTVSVTVGSIILKISSFTPNPTLSSTSFSMTIGVYDSSGLSIENNLGVYPVSLTLSNSGVLSGTATGSTSAGVITFSSLRILSSGTFTITASANGVTSVTTGSLTIGNYVHSVTVTSDSLTPSMNFNFIVTVTLKSEDNVVYTGSSVVVTLTENAGSTVGGSAIVTTATGISSHTIFFPSTGSKTIRATIPLSGTYASVSNTVTVTVQSLKLTITNPSTLPTNSLNSFTIQVYVKDSTAASTESTRGPYTVALSINTGTLSGTLSKSTTSGLAEFTNLRILSRGSFTITATSTGITQASTNAYVNIINYAYTLTMTASTSTPSVNFVFNLVVSIKGEDNSAFLGSCTLTLSESTSSLTMTSLSSVLTTSTGSTTIQVYFNSAGSKTITATCPASGSSPAVSGSASVTVSNLKMIVTTTAAASITSLTTLQVTAGVYNSAGTSIEASYGPYTIELSLNPAGSFSGTISSTTVSGTKTFTGLRVLSSGTFYIEATAVNWVTGSTSSTIVVTNYVTSITLVTSNSTPSKNFGVTITATLKGEDNNAFTGSCTLSLSDSLNAMTAYSGSFSQSNNAGTVIFYAYFTSIGLRTITASTSGSVGLSTGTVSSTIQITVENLSLRVVTFTPLPSTSLDTFSIQIGVYDKAGLNIEASRGPYSISITLTSGVLSGTSSHATSSGVYTFSDLRILSAGSIAITATTTTTNVDSITSSYVSVTNYVHTITLVTSDSSPTVNFAFTITATLKGEDNNLFTGSCTVSLVETGGSTVYGVDSLTTTSGTAAMSIYFSTVGTKTVEASCPVLGSYPRVSQSIQIQVLTLVLVLHNFSPAADSLTEFSVEVRVCSNNGVTTESNRGPYTISLSISPSSGTVSGTVIGDTISTGITGAGTKTFTNLRILTMGDFTLTASSSGINSAVSSEFSITNYPHTITLTTSTATPSKNFEFTISVTIRGEDTQLYIGTCTLTLTEPTSSIFGTTSSAITTGEGDLDIYLNSLGEKTITATCPSLGSNPEISATISVTVLTCILQITSFTPTPSTSLNEFTITVGVYDNSGTTVESVRGPYTIELALSNSGVLHGTASGSTSSGIISFTPLRVLSSGSFIITATSTGITSDDTGPAFTIQNYVYTIELTTSNPTPTKNFNFVITAGLKGEDGRTFTGTATVDLTETQGEVIGGTASVSTSTGTAELTIYFTTIGTKYIRATSGTVTQNIEVTVPTLTLKITSFTPSPTTSLIEFSVVVGVYDYDSNALETLRGPYSVSLTLTPTGTFSGTIVKNTSSGVVTFSNLRILSANTFILSATATGVGLDSTLSFTVTNFVHTITATTTASSFSANFAISITVDIKGEDGNAFTSSATISLTVNTGTISGTTSTTTLTGQGVLSVFFTTIGTKIITAACNSKTTTLTLTITVNILKFDALAAIPTKSSDSFSVTVRVYNTQGNTVESSNGPYTVTLSLTSSGVFFGTVSLSTTNGVAAFTGLRVLSAGTFNIVAACSGMTSATYSSLTITNYAHTATVASSTSTPSLNFYFTVTVTLYGEDNRVYRGGCLVTLTSSETVLGASVGTTSNAGINTFSVYFANTGVKIITATCPASGSYSQVSSTVTVTVQSNILKFITITPTPTNSLAVFTITVGVYDYSGTTLENSYGTYPISISISNSGNLLGTTSGTTSSGRISFTSLRITSNGSYIFTATSTNSGVTSGTSTTLNIKNYVYLITVTTSTDFPIANFPFELTTTLRGEDGNLFSGSCTVSLFAGSSTISGTTSSVVTGGTKIFTIRFPKPGAKTVSAICPGSDNSPSVTGTKSLTVTENTLKISSPTPTPTLSTNEFSVTVTVHNTVGNVLESTYGPYSVTITLTQEGTLLGTLNKITISGSVTFSNLRIISSGVFTITASSPDMNSDTSNSVTISNLASKISISSNNNNPTMSFNFIITVTITGEDLRPFTGAATVTLTETSGMIIEGVTSDTTSTGTISFTIRINNMGTANIQAACFALTDTISFKVLKGTLIIDSVNPLPSLSTDVFSVTVGVYDSTGLNLETNEGIYTVTLSLSDNGVFLGTTVLSTSSGIVTFYNLQILSRGKFKITASSTNVNSGTYSLNAVTNLLTSIIVTSSINSPRTYDKFIIKAQLIGEDDAIYLGDADVVIDENSGKTINGVTLVETSTGIAKFNIYIDTPGTCTFEISSGSVTSQISLNIIDRVNKDPLCDIGTSENICKQCITNARLKDGICSCTVHSTYTSSTRSCDCDTGFESSNDFCVTCNNYLLASEISASLESDLKTIIVTFSSQVKTSALKVCSEYLTLPVILQDYTYICIWETSMRFIIKFEKFIPLTKEIELIFDPSKVVGTGTDCNLKIEELFVKVNNNNNLPTPDSSFTAPQTFSTFCAKTGFSVVAAGVGSTYSYKWSASTDPKASDLETFVSGVTASHFVVPIDLLTSKTIQLTLIATLSNSDKSSTTTNKILITSSQSLLVYLSTGNRISIKKSTPCVIKALIEQGCGNGNYIYSWSYESGPDLDFAAIKKNSEKDSNLVIPAHSLTPGSEYEFTVKVSDGSSSGSASVKIEVLNSEIEIRLSRTSGEISTKQDLTIQAFASDPDDKSATFLYTWECYELDSRCKDKNDDNISLSDFSSTLTLSKDILKDSAVYTFTVKVEANDKTGERSVDITINSSINGDIKLETKDSKLDQNSKVSLIPNISSETVSTFVWEVSEGSDISGIGLQTMSYLFIKPNKLMAGESYVLKLTMKSEDSANTVSSYINLYCNLGPTCESFSGSLESNIWALSASGCVDGDDNDYPLTYQFGAKMNKKQVWITSSISLSSGYFNLPSSSSSALVRVCDSINSCTDLTYAISSSNTRLLTDVLEDFQADIQDTENIPASVIIYSNLDPTSSNLKFIYSTMKSFFISEYFTSSVFDLYLSCIEAILSNNNKISSEVVNDSVELTVKVLNLYDSQLTDEQGEKILSIYSGYLEVLHQSLANELLETTCEYWSIDSMPGTKIEYSDDDLYFLLYRDHTSEFYDLKISNGLGQLTFPNSLPFDSESIIDAFYISYLDTGSSISTFKFYISGSYANYSLILQSPKESEILLSNPIKLTLLHKLENIDNIECIYLSNLNWTEAVCTISDLYSDKVIVDLYYNSHFTVKEVENSLKIEKLCIFILFAFAAIGAALFIFSACRDSYVLDDISVKKPFVLIYPLTSLMIPQEKPWRFLMAAQLITTELILLALTGSLFRYILRENTISLLSLIKGSISLALTQAFTISCMLINFASLSHIRIHYISFALCFILSGSSISIIVFMVLQGASEYIGLWVSFFMLYMLFDMFILQVIYSYFMSRRKQIRKPRLPIQHENQTDISKMFEKREIRRPQNNSVTELVEPSKKNKTKVYEDDIDSSIIHGGSNHSVNLMSYTGKKAKDDGKNI